jgi:hypothetical protein
MRSKLLALLIALLPLQLCWAAVAPYAHKDARGAAHIAGVHGLEILQSQENPFDVGPVYEIALDSSQQTDANPAAPQPSLIAAIAAVHEFFGAIAFALKPPPAPLRPERPQWRALA